MKLKNVFIAIFILLAIGGWMFSKQIADMPFVKNILTQDLASDSPSSESSPPKNAGKRRDKGMNMAGGGRGGGVAPKKKAIAMETVISVAEQYSQKITLPSTIDSKGYLSIHSRVNSGTVKKILVQNGQRVQKGQLLMELSSDFIPEQYQDHKEKYAIAADKFNADKQLYDKKLISEYTFKQSQNAMTAAKVRMLATKKTYDHHFIRAPFGGIVDMIFVNPFAQVGANTKLLDLNDQKSYTIKTSLPINTLQHITLDTRFVATDAAGTHIEGYISGISSNANPQTSTYAAEGTITTTGTFNIGEPLYIQVLTKTVLAHDIPLSQVLLNDDGNMAIKVVEDNTIVLKPITVLWEDLTIAKVTGLGEQAEIFSLGAGFAEVGTPYPPVPDTVPDTVSDTDESPTRTPPPSDGSNTVAKAEPVATAN